MGIGPKNRKLLGGLVLFFGSFAFILCQQRGAWPIWLPKNHWPRRLSNEGPDTTCWLAIEGTNFAHLPFCPLLLVLRRGDPPPCPIAGGQWPAAKLGWAAGWPVWSSGLNFLAFIFYPFIQSCYF
jgi:hypothetical protein